MIFWLWIILIGILWISLGITFFYGVLLDDSKTKQLEPDVPTFIIIMLWPITIPLGFIFSIIDSED